MTEQTKRYNNTVEESNKERQLSSLFSIISNNILVATEVLSTDHRIEAVQKLESLSRKAKLLAKELVSNSDNKIAKEALEEKMSYLKHTMLELIVDLTDELGKLDYDKKSEEKSIQDLILAKRLLRESQRGLITIQD